MSSMLSRRLPFSRVFGSRSLMLGGEYGKWSPFTLSVLPNGVRVATQKMLDMSDNGPITLAVHVNAGSRHETAETNGTANFLERLNFAGTTSRPHGQYEKEVENMGGRLNAYTDREHAMFSMRCLKSDMKQGFDLLSDGLLNSTYDKDVMEREREAILQEVDGQHMSYEEVLLDRMHMSAYRDCSLSFPVMGHAETVKTIQRDHLVNYVKQNYTGENLIVVAVGDVDHAQFHKEAEAKFGHLPNTSGPRPVLGHKPYFVWADLTYRNDDMGPWAYWVVAYEGVPWRSATHLPFQLMSQIIGEYHKEQFIPGIISGNRTTNACAHKMVAGCAEEYRAFNFSYSDTGAYGFYLKNDEVATENALGELLFQNTMLSHSLTDEQVELAKKQLITKMGASLNTSYEIADDIGRQLIAYGRRIPIAEFEERLSKIDAEEVKKVAYNHLHNVGINIVGIGALHGYGTYVEYMWKTSVHRY